MQGEIPSNGEQYEMGKVMLEAKTIELDELSITKPLPVIFIFSLEFHDLSNQNTNVGRTVSRNGVSDYRSNVLGRYVFLSCSWRFGNFGC
ncbi:hypothetical protein [Parapedobacter composti]|uniref:hypothetical protein n=1 Tax=Parapedobacter composti TaxID=623281 RepID=UPI00147CCD19|nr:hypothetical protein [Parapedobacter composti]